MTRTVRLGLFIVAGAILLFLGLFAIGDKTFLFSNTIEVRSRFTRVAGLQAGAAVQYQGINVGRVSSVRLPTAPGGPIDVTMAISSSASHLITKNTQAQIKSDGLVGDQIIVLVSTNNPGDPIEDDDILRGIDPFDLFEISDRAIATVREFEQAARSFDQIMNDIQDQRGTLGRIVYDDALYNQIVATMDETRSVMDGLSTSAQANAELLVGIAERAAAGVESVVAKVDSGDGTFARLLNDPGLYDTMVASADTLRGIAAELQSVSKLAGDAATWGLLGSSRFAELMEAAKHNWLFRRYFEERGHVEMAPFEIREQAITESYQRLEVLRAELEAWEARLSAREASMGGPAADSTANR